MTTSERIKGPICDSDALPSFSNFDATSSSFNSGGTSSFPLFFRVNYLVYSGFILVNFIPYSLTIPWIFHHHPRLMKFKNLFLYVTISSLYMLYKNKRNCLFNKDNFFLFYSVTCTCCTCKTFKVRSSTIFSRSVPNGSFRSVGQGEKSNSKIERLLIHNMVVRYKN